MNDNNIFLPLFDNTLYISATYLTSPEIAHYLVKLKAILKQNTNIDNDLAEMFQDTNWRTVNTGCIALVMAKKNRSIDDAIEAAWLNIAMHGPSAEQLMAALSIADEKYDQHKATSLLDKSEIDVTLKDEWRLHLLNLLDTLESQGADKFLEPFDLNKDGNFEDELDLNF